jgi:hypothetical protein
MHVRDPGGLTGLDTAVFSMAFPTAFDDIDPGAACIILCIIPCIILARALQMQPQGAR